MHISKSNISVRYVETDKMGIVHHSNYYVYFEVGRCDYLKDVGLNYVDIEAEGIMLPVTDSQCKYMDCAVYGDELIIETYVKEFNPVKIVFGYNVIRHKDNKIIAKGSTIHPFVSKEFKIINLKKNKPMLWEIIKKFFE